MLRHRAFLNQPKLAAELTRNRLAREILWRATRRAGDAWEASLAPGGSLRKLVGDCADGKMDLESAVEKVLKAKVKP